MLSLGWKLAVGLLWMDKVRQPIFLFLRIYQMEIYVKPTIAGIREGRDELIEAAVHYIMEKNK